MIGSLQSLLAELQSPDPIPLWASQYVWAAFVSSLIAAFIGNVVASFLKEYYADLFGKRKRRIEIRKHLTANLLLFSTAYVISIRKKREQDVNAALYKAARHQKEQLSDWEKVKSDYSKFSAESIVEFKNIFEKSMQLRTAIVADAYELEHYLSNSAYEKIANRFEEFWNAIDKLQSDKPPIPSDCTYEEMSAYAANEFQRQMSKKQKEISNEFRFLIGDIHSIVGK